MHYKYQVKNAINRHNKKDSSIVWEYEVTDKGHSVYIEIIAKKNEKEVIDGLSLSKRNGYMAAFFRVNSKIDVIRKRLINKELDKSFLDSSSFSPQS